MNGQGRPILRWFVDASLVMALASLPPVLAMWWTVSRQPWFLVLVAVVAVNAAALAWLRGASERLGPATTMCVLCGLQWATALLVTWIEPWSMHITPLASVAPLAVAPQAMDRRRLAELAMAGVGVLIAIAAVGRFTPGFGLHDATSVPLRNVVSVGWVGAFTMLVSASSWFSYGALAAEVERLAESRRRLLSAAARSRQLFEQRLAMVREALVELRGGLYSRPIRPGSPPPPEWLTGLRLELARATELLRELGHGLVGISGAQDDLAATVRLVGQRSPHDVNVEFGVGQRLPHDVASALVAIVAEATGPGAWRGVAPAPAVDVEIRELSSHFVVLLVRFRTGPTGPTGSAGTPGVSAGEASYVGSVEAHDGRMPGLDPIVVEVIGDHAAACDGDVEILAGAGGPELVVRLPLDAKLPSADPVAGGTMVPALPAGTGLRPVTRAFSPLLIFPVLMPLVAGALALTVLRSPIMTIITALAVAFYGLPAFVARRIARRRPFVAGLICTLSAGLVGVFVVSRLNFVRLWAMPLLVSPSLTVLPYVTRRAFAWLTTLATVGTVAVFTAGRLGREDPVADRSPELLNDMIAVTLVPAAFAGLVLVLHRNQTGLLQVGTALRLSRRRVIGVMGETRHRLERDLHDGAQQRLIAAGIRLQIVERAAAGDDAARNLELVAGELDAALVALADVESIAAPAVLGVGGLGEALRSVATASPLPVVVEFDVPATLDDRLASAVYLSCCECLTNSAKHGGPAVSVLVSVGLLGEMLEFRVTDDGRGFQQSEAEVSGGTGLRNIRHRLGALGGELAVASSRSGTIVHGSVPLSPPR